MSRSDPEPDVLMGASRDPDRWVRHGLNAVVALVWVLLLFELASPAPAPDASTQQLDLSRVAVPVGALTLFLVIPAGLFALRLLERGRAATRPVYHTASRIFLGLSWLPTWIPIVLMLASLEPWPIRLRQGPDTDYARGHFARFIGREPPESVEGIHYCEPGSLGKTRFLRFTCRDRAVIEELVDHLYLEPFESGGTVVDPQGWYPSWWPAEDLPAARRWSRGDGWATSLWYAEDQGLALYRGVSY